MLSSFILKNVQLLLMIINCFSMTNGIMKYDQDLYKKHIALYNNDCYNLEYEHYKSNVYRPCEALIGYDLSWDIIFVKQSMFCWRIQDHCKGEGLENRKRVFDYTTCLKKRHTQDNETNKTTSNVYKVPESKKHQKSTHLDLVSRFKILMQDKKLIKRLATKHKLHIKYLLDLRPAQTSKHINNLTSTNKEYESGHRHSKKHIEKKGFGLWQQFMSKRNPMRGCRNYELQMNAINLNGHYKDIYGTKESLALERQANEKSLINIKRKGKTNTKTNHENQKHIKYITKQIEKSKITKTHIKHKKNICKNGSLISYKGHNEKSKKKIKITKNIRKSDINKKKDINQTNSFDIV